MKTIISKQVLALWPGGNLLEDDFFRRIRESLGHDPYTQKEESGATKKNVLSPTGFGSRWRENNPGAGIGTGYEDEESPSRGVGSGYNDGEQADVDEAGPGFSPKQPEPYPVNEFFLDLDIKNSGAPSGSDLMIRKNLEKILKHPPVNYSTRFPVDRK